MLESLKLSLLYITSLLTPVWYPPGAGPETIEQRAERWGMIANVQAEVSLDGHTEFWPADNAALLVAIQHGESAYGYRVHGGEKSPIGHQDRGRARCLAQIHWHKPKWPNRQDWLALAGRDREATKRCAVATLDLLWAHAKRCKLRRKVPIARRWKSSLAVNEVRVLVSAYGTGTSCKPVAKNHSKVLTYRWARRML